MPEKNSEALFWAKFMETEFEIREIEFGSEIYGKSLELRDRILRRPLGMRIENDNLDNEKQDFHIGILSNSSVVGILVLTKLSDSEIKMRQVAVDELIQGTGLGAGMVRFAEDFAKNRNYKKMVLNARKVVVGFYEKLGYQTEGEEFIEVSIPHFKMFKILKEG